MAMSKNKRRKSKRYAVGEEYYEYLYDVLLERAGASVLITFRDENGDVIGRRGAESAEDAKKIVFDKKEGVHKIELNYLNAFKNQVDCSLWTKDRDLFEKFLEYVRKRDPELAKVAEFELIQSVDKINH